MSVASQIRTKKMEEDAAKDQKSETKDSSNNHTTPSVPKGKSLASKYKPSRPFKQWQSADYEAYLNRVARELSNA